MTTTVVYRDAETDDELTQCVLTVNGKTYVAYGCGKEDALQNAKECLPKNSTSFDMHHSCMSIAREELAKHIGPDDEADSPEKCFNRFTYLESLEMRMDTILHDRNLPHGRFQLDGTQVARYLYACLCLEGGDSPDSDTFRGMPILD